MLKKILIIIVVCILIFKYYIIEKISENQDTVFYVDTCNETYNFTEEYFSNTLLELKEEILDLFRDSNEDASFVYKEKDTDYSFSYRENLEYYAASVNKIATVLYLYEQAELKEIDLNDKMTYTSKYYVGEDGVIKNSPYGTEYTISEIIEKVMIYSDNAGYYMLLDKVGGTNVIETYWKSLNVPMYFTDSFGALTAKGGSMYLDFLYDYYLTNTTYSKKLINDMINSNNLDVISNGMDVKIAHKYGDHDIYYHDISLVLSDNPYTLSIMSTKGYTNYSKFFQNVHTLINSFHNLFWEERNNYCIIEQ